MSGILIILFVVGIILGIALNYFALSYLLSRMNFLEENQKKLLKSFEKQERIENIEKAISHLFKVVGAIHNFHLHQRSFRDGDNCNEEWKEGYQEDENDEEPHQEIPWVNEFIEKHGRNQSVKIPEDDPLNELFGES